MSGELSRILLVNALWSFAGRFGYLAITLISNIILVRLLGPEEFGQLGIIMFFIAIASVLTESGLSGALVRKKNIKEVDYSTVFIFNMIVSFSLMLALIVSSGYIANFYGSAELEYLLSASSVILIINALSTIQTTRLVRELQFKKKSAYEVISVLVGAVVAIILAYLNAGVWSLVALQLVTSATLAILMWTIEGNLKTYSFSMHAFKEFYAFGVNTTLASLLNTAFNNAYQIILAKYFTISQAGFYYQAKKLQDLPVSILNTIMQGAVYSALSKVQDNSAAFNALYEQVVRYFSIIAALICLLIFCYADAIVALLYGEQWAGSVFYLKLLVIAGFFYLQELFNRVVFKVFDATGRLLQLEVLKKTIQSFTIIYGIWTASIENLIYGFVVSSVISFFINYYCARRVQRHFSWSEVLCLAKIVFVAVVISVVFNYFFVFERSVWMSFATIPFVILLYFCLLHFLKVVNTIKELPKIIKLIR